MKGRVSLTSNIFNEVLGLLIVCNGKEGLPFGVTTPPMWSDSAVVGTPKRATPPCAREASTGEKDSKWLGLWVERNKTSEHSLPQQLHVAARADSSVVSRW